MLLARLITALRLPSGLQEAVDEAAVRARDQRSAAGLSDYRFGL